MEQEQIVVTGPLLTPRQVAKRLGVSAKTIRRWLGTAQLPVYFLKLPNGGIRVPQSELDEYIQAGRSVS